MSEVIRAFLSVEWGLKGAAEVMNLHPLFVHFPIALFLSAVFFYAVGLLIRNDGFLAAGKWALVLGAISAAFTVWQGLLAEATVPHAEAVHETLVVHKHLGYLILGLSLFLSAWVLLSRVLIPAKGRWFFLGALICLSLLVIQTGDLGGRMVFLHGTGVGAKSRPEGSAEPREAHDHDRHEHRHGTAHEDGGHEHDHGGSPGHAH